MRKHIYIFAIAVLLQGCAGHMVHKAQQDCHTVKETCNRKKGCRCKLNCDKEGRRLPPAGGKEECASFCCEEKCECHMMGCP